MYEKLKQGQRVQYKFGFIEGTGKVVGVSSTEMMFIGATYIIELDEPIKDYEYSHIVMAQIYLKKIE